MPIEQLLSFLILVDTSSMIKVWMLRNCRTDLPGNERFRATGSIPSSAASALSRATVDGLSRYSLGVIGNSGIELAECMSAV
jgi:hypothetical protein